MKPAKHLVRLLVFIGRLVHLALIIEIWQLQEI